MKKIKKILFNIFEQGVIEAMKQALRDHDEQDNRHFHQAMVLCQTIETINPVAEFVMLYNQGEEEPRNQCKQYTGQETANVKQQIMDQFLRGNLRTLVVCGSLIEGFDHKKVSVLGLIRNLNSDLLFSQFVGRALRLIDQNDPVTAQIIGAADEKRLINKRWNFYTNPEVDD